MYAYQHVVLINHRSPMRVQQYPNSMVRGRWNTDCYWLSYSAFNSSHICEILPVGPYALSSTYRWFSVRPEYRQWFNNGYTAVLH